MRLCDDAAGSNEMSVQLKMPDDEVKNLRTFLVQSQNKKLLEEERHRLKHENGALAKKLTVLKIEKCLSRSHAV